VFFKSKITNSLLFSFLILSLLSCAQGTIDPVDQQTGSSREEFKKTIMKDFSSARKKDAKKGVSKDGKKSDSTNAEESETTDAPIPNISRLVVAPPPPSTVTSKTISFSVTDQVPLKDVLIELGRVAKIDVDIDPNISGGIIINASNRPLGEIIDRIAFLGRLRYSYEKGILHFERDTPYTINYPVDYLSEGSNLWNDVQSNITAILNNSASTTSSINSSSNNNTTDGVAQSFAPLPKSTITINKTAGIISIFATKSEHSEITKYLNNVEKNASSQVLIEAKVIEVKLNDTFKTGINWQSLGKQNTISGNNSFDSTSPITFVASELFNSDITASISALETFGTTRTLSSPRIHAINNQKATLNFTNKLVYFKIDNNQNTTTTSASASVNAQTLTSTKQEENVGVELNIIPSINLQTSEVTLNIKPKITIKTGDVQDPASPIDKNGNIIFKNLVPVIQTRELNTIAKIQSGHVIVIGGLMSESAASTDTGVPFLQRIPLLGLLFKSNDKTSEVIETVIFIKATIVNSGPVTNKVDRDIQEKFDTNRRKFF
jgi:general secretion pathway protein D